MTYTSSLSLKPSNSHLLAKTTLDKLVDVWKDMPALFRQYQNVLVLRAALDNSPTEDGRLSLSLAINSCLEDPWRLQRLGWELFTDLICTSELCVLFFASRWS